MGLIKYFNRGTLSWEIVAASDAANIALHNEILLDSSDAAISTARAFLKINNKISQLEHHLAWIYLNGAKGGGGGGGGGGYAYTITINNGKDTFYTSTNSITINMTINSGTTRKTFYVNAINMATGRMLVDGESHTSMVPFDFTIPNLPSATNYIYLQAYDSLDNYTELVEIVVNVGSLSIVQSGRPGAIYTIGSNNNTTAAFQVLNKTGANSYLLTYRTRNIDPLADALNSGGSLSNNFGADYMTVITPNTLASVYSIDFNLSLMEQEVGRVVTYRTILYSEELGFQSSYFSNQITISTGNALSAILYGLGETASDAGDYLFELNNYCTFNLLLYYEKVDVRTFYYRYKVYKDSELFYESQINTMQASTSTPTTVNCPTQNFPIGDDYRLVVEACATDDFDASHNQNLYSSTEGYFGIKQGQVGILQDYKGALLARFGSFNFPGGQLTKWTYNLAHSGDYYFTSWPASAGYSSTTMNIHNATITTGLNTNVYRYVNLSGNTYATIDEFSTLFPQSTNLNNSLFGTGFYMLVTYEYLSDNPVDLTILSFGEYQDGSLYKGFEINSDYIRVAFGTISGIQIDTPIRAENAYGNSSSKSTRTTTIGLNVWSTTVKTRNNTELNTYYFALYIDGVMTKCALIPDSVLQNASTGWMFGQSLYLGCRPDLTNQANCYIYDFKLYAQNQPDLSIVHNYMSATEQAHLILSSTGQPTIDDELDTILRNKNLFVKGGNTCILCDTSTGEYLDPATMYSRIASSYSDVTSGYDLDYPIVYIEEVGTTSDMYQCVKATWDVQATVGGVRITKKAWPVKITITTKYGTTIVYSDDPALQPTVLIQGTSSLSYNSKNLEIIMGQVEEGKDKLLKINGWLPENEFTLKADVVDSAHVNNVAIGNFVNNTEFMEHYQGSGYSVDDTIGRKIKKTSEGFPCLVFVKYSNGSVDEGTNITRDTDGTILSKVGKTEFMGVYNFNLGRYAYYNLGLKKLLSYEEDTSRNDLAPQIITEYTYSIPDGIYSMEVGDNFGNTEELFTQADKTISEYITECRYTPTTEDNAYLCITDTVFTALAQADASATFNRKRRNANGEYEDILDNNGNVLQWVSDSTLSDEVTIDLNLDLIEARKYLVLALVFGLVDSVCKNMVFRTWDANRWILAFYDMDTAFKKDNRGSSSVKYDAHYNYFFNTQGIYDDAMNSYTESVTLFPRSVDDPNWKYVYAGMCSSTGVPNRIWNTIQQCDTRKITSGDYASTLPGIYWTLRNMYIKDPDAFIDEYFSDYVNKTGAIMYNYDYRQKYVSYNQIWLEGVGLVADTSASQTEFLDGTRVSLVRTWFKKRINFLDSVYASFREGNTNSDSYLKDSFQAGQKSTYTVATVTIIADQRCKIGYAASSGNVRYIWVDETAKSYNLQTQTEGNLFYIYGQSMIVLFPGFNKLGWETFNYAINFKLLRELDMSGLHVNAFTNSDNLSGLPNIRILNLNNFVYEGNNSITIGLTHNESLKELYMGGECNISSFQLPSTGTLEVLDLTDNSYISSIPTQTVNGVTQSCLIDQSGLRILKLAGTSITSMYGLNLGLVNLPSLETLDLPYGLEKLTISNCGLPILSYTWSNYLKLSKLTHIEITNCENLEVVDLSGLNNLTELSIYNCPNIRELNLSRISARTVNIDFTSLTKLEKLMIDDTTIFSSLDLSHCPDLFGLSCRNCMNLRTVICTRDESNHIELQYAAFENCRGLTELTGYFDLYGPSIFAGCESLPFDSLLDSGRLKIKFGEYHDFSKTFKQCYLLGKDSDYPMQFIWLLPSITNNISEMFYETSSDFLMDPDMFCRKVDGLMMNLNVTTISGIFYGTKISGNFYSEYYDDGLNHGFFAHMPNLLNCEYAFAASSAERYIDNDFFHNAVSRNLTNVDYMFLFSSNLKAVNDTTGSQIRVLEPLHSKDFFIYLENCIHPENKTFETTSTPYPDWPYPIGVFLGTEIKMTVDLDENGKPFLFHHAKQAYATKRIYLENGLYQGVHLILDPDNCDYSYLFGGNSLIKSINDGTNTYYIPKFVRINQPFNGSDELYLDLSKIDGQIFFDLTTQYISYPFMGMNVLNTDTIPDNIFYGALNVLQLRGFFSGLNLNNLAGGQVYDFSQHNIFLYCTSLLNIESIFSGCNKFRMRLASNMFINCKLVNVSNAFYNSRVIEKLPERLFYMEDSHGNVLRTINNMASVFEGCYNLGYLNDYVFAEVPRTLGDSMITTDTTVTTWVDHVYENGTFLGNSYTIPQDIFWYCTSNAQIGDVLGQMFWKKRTAVEDDNNPGIYLILVSDTWIGPQCAIPNMILSNPETEISKSDSLPLVFSGTHFKPSGTLGEQGVDGVYVRGNLYPDDLFSGMSNLENINGMFRDTIIYKECMINPKLFVYGTHQDELGNTVEDYLPLKNISSVWLNCTFNYLVTIDEEGQYQVDEVGHPQIDFTMFDPLNTLTNASYLFAATRENDCGLRVLSDDLFKNLDFTGYPTKTFNITGMFLDTHLAVDSTMAPVFPNVRRNLAVGYNTYLNGLLESLIINAAQVRAAGLHPTEWDRTD